MKFSYQWISELVPGLDKDPAELQRLITMKTAECEGIEPAGAHFNDVLAARVLNVTALPKGKNKSVTIDTGGGRQAVVVCGAPNVRPGMLAPWVPPGTTLGEKTISRAVIEGVESEGMLASAAELGINRDHAGLLDLSGIEPGQRLDCLRPDWIIEIDNKSLTHRPDLWGHYGMAREVAAITGRTLLDPVKPERLPSGAPAIGVKIADYTLCPRYSALVLEAVKVEPSPLWLQARLESIGLNPINNIVDTTNYILAELPQPMHAFDADKLAGNTIFIRSAAAGESLRALNDQTYSLTPADLVIADANSPIALAGVIGGADSAITETTTRVVLESANFHAATIRLTSARYKLRTDASVRFEKSLDPENTIRGLARAVELLACVSPGVRVVGGVADDRGPVARLPPILLPMSFVTRKLGKELSENTVTGILQALGFHTSVTASGVLTVTVPSWRATKDIGLKDDLVEEVGRMVGYQEIVPAAPRVACTVPPANPMRLYLRQVRNQLAAQGFTEIYNYSFINESDAKRFVSDINAHVAVQNPIASELTHLRRSLIPGLFKNILSNVRHSPEFRIFEIGNEIHPKGSELPDEITHAAAAIYSAHGDERDFFEMKRAVECLFPSSRLVAVDARAYEHPTRTAEILWRNSVIGRIFELHPSLLQEEGIEGRAVLFDVDLRLAQQLAAATPVKYKPLRKYPTSGFDLSVVAGLKTPVESIEDDLRKLAGADLALIDFIRQYDGPPLPPGQKSVSYHLEVGALDHTMSADEVTEIRNRLIQGMRDLGFDLRV
ncbi:MAG TPA: phenylalanine--tRNA ligase subunit beta [Bryobacteraceae bacterium]|nr:phenylalanine--tRNA ligase subunit beta [Bryobacteraceae bacterium]